MGLSEIVAKKIAQKKGQKRKSKIEKILRANNITNTKVVTFNEIFGEEQREITADVRTLFYSDEEVRQQVLRCVPERLLEKANDVDAIAQYALTEIGLILSMPGVKFGHEKERKYDAAATSIHDKHGIGHDPSFMYIVNQLSFSAFYRNK